MCLSRCIWSARVHTAPQQGGRADDTGDAFFLHLLSASSSSSSSDADTTDLTGGERTFLFFSAAAPEFCISHSLFCSVAAIVSCCCSIVALRTSFLSHGVGGQTMTAPFRGKHTLLKTSLHQVTLLRRALRSGMHRTCDLVGSSFRVHFICLQTCLFTV